MEYLDKLKAYSGNVKNVFMRGMIDTVCTVQHTVRDVLPGNPLTRDYEIIKHVGFAGPNFSWKIYSAVKKSSKQEASVFVFEKKLLDKYGKNLKEEIIDRFRRGVQQITRIKHPKILSIQHHLEESRDSLAFAAEPVEGTLADILGICNQTAATDLFDVEIRYGILQICDALKFLHNEVKLIHHNICPESIMITLESATWKLGCFEMAIQGLLDTTGKTVTYFSHGVSPDAPEFINPNLNYLAPEANLSQLFPSSDMYSLGILIYTLYNKGKPLYECYNNYKTYINQIKKTKHMSTLTLNNVPEAMKSLLLNLLLSDPSSRLLPDALIKNQAFDEIGVRTLEYFDSLFQVDNLQRSMFYKSLPQIISNLPMRVNLRRVLAVFAMEFVNAEMVPFILPNIFIIAERANDEEYQKYVFPRLKEIFAEHVSFQTLLVIMRNMQLLLKRTHHDDVKTFILPILYNALDSNCLQVQEMCISIIPSFASLVDSRAMRTAVLPRLKRICLETTILSYRMCVVFHVRFISLRKRFSARVNCLLCVGKLVNTFDKWMIIDDVLPLLQSVPSREPAVLMTILGIIKLAFQNKDGLTKEALANKVVPLLLPLSIETSLNLDQFTAYINFIKEVLDQIEKEHKIKLQQIGRLDNNCPLLTVNAKEKTTEVVPIIEQVMREFSFENTLHENCEFMKLSDKKIPSVNKLEATSTGKTSKNLFDPFEDILRSNQKTSLATNAFSDISSLDLRQCLRAPKKDSAKINDRNLDPSLYRLSQENMNLKEREPYVSHSSNKLSTSKTAFDDINDLLG